MPGAPRAMQFELSRPRHPLRATYIYNPKCGCAWCVNDGSIPTGTPGNGHSFGYEAPHIPPSRCPWTHRAIEAA